MLWILTVHIKYEENPAFGCISINFEETMKNAIELPWCDRFVSQILLGAERIFLLHLTKSWTRFVIFKSVAVSLQHWPALCLSPCTQFTSIRGASFCLPALTSCRLQRADSITLFTTTQCEHRSEKATRLDAFKAENSPKYLHMEICLKQKNRNFLFFLYFPEGVYSKWGSRCFHTDVQGYQWCNAAARNPSSLADPSSALACPRHNISAQPLILVHSWIIRDINSFPVLHLQSVLAGAAAAVKESARTSLHIAPCSHLNITHK